MGYCAQLSRSGMKTGVTAHNAATYVSSTLDSLERCVPVLNVYVDVKCIDCSDISRSELKTHCPIE